MSVWLTMLKKDIWMLKNQWLGFMALAVVVTIAVFAAHLLGIMDAARSAVIVGIVLTGSLFIVFPAQLYRGINQEVKGSAALWLQTPQSGWAMFGSKLICSLIGSLMYFGVVYVLVLLLFHAGNLTHALLPLQYEIQAHVKGNGIASAAVHAAPAYVSVLAAQVARVEFFIMTGLFLGGIYFALWIVLVYLSVRAVRNQFRKFGWLVGLGVVLVGTWVLGVLQSTSLYARIFGWGKVPVLDLFPSEVRTLLAGHLVGTIDMGNLAFYALAGALLFYLTGLIIDRYLEV